jgi:hypothetical protein
MGAAAIVAAIGVGAAGFMLWFLFGLLREGAPSVSYWAVPVLRQKRETFQVLDARHEDRGFCKTADGCNDYRANLLENQNHEQGKCGSGLITLNIRAISGGLGWRAIQSQRNYILTERRR